MAKATERIDTVGDAVESFFGQIFKPKEELKAQLERKGKTEDEDGIDWKKVEENDALYISSVFDSLEWWKSVGQNQHPLIYFAALLIIGLPASNGFQEQIFSGCTHHDDSLCQSVGDDNFEESVLLSANDSFGTLSTLSVGEI